MPLIPFFKSIYDVAGFQFDNIAQFVKNYFNLESETTEDPKRRELLCTSLIEKIRHDANLRGIARIPVNTMLIVMLWEDHDDDDTFPNTTSGIFAEMVEFIVARNASKVSSFATYL